jgi:hypothetical protein
LLMSVMCKKYSRYTNNGAYYRLRNLVNNSLLLLLVVVGVVVEVVVVVGR